MLEENTRESIIYSLLKEKGSLTPTFIARETGIKRQNTYRYLTKLMNKGLVVKLERGKYGVRRR